MSATKELDIAIEKIKILFKFIGVKLDNKTKQIEKTDHHFFYTINVILLILALIGEIVWLVKGVNEGKSFTELTFIVPCTTLGILSIVKSLFHVINEDSVDKLTDELRKLETNKRNTSDVEKYNILVAETNFMNVVVKVLNFIIGITVIVFLTAPITLMAVHYFNTDEIEFILPFFMVYPFDPYNVKFWPVAYFHQFWSTCLVALQLGSVDSLFYTLCTFIHIYFKYLQEDFRNIISAQGMSREKLSENEEFRNKFVALVQRHHKLMFCVDLLQKIYTMSTSFNFMTSSFLICLAGFNVTTNNDVTTIVSFLIFLFMSLAQIFFLCLFGDMIMVSSMEVSDAIYNSKWYLADSYIGKKLFMVLIRSQKPCKLTALGYFDVSLKAFMKIMSTSWSYFTLLRTIYSPRQTK